MPGPGSSPPANQPAPALLGLGAPPLPRPVAPLQCVLLAVEAVDHEGCPRSPSTRIRGPGAAATDDAHRCERTPDSWRERDEDVVVGGAAAAVVDLAVDLGDGAEQLDGLVDQVGAEVEQQPAASCPRRPPRATPTPRSSGRQRSKRDSKRCTSPSSPSSISRRRVRKSESQRRLWKTVSGTPAARARSTSARAPPRRRRERLVDDDREAGSIARVGQRHVRRSGVATTTRSCSAAPRQTASAVASTRPPDAPRARGSALGVRGDDARQLEAGGRCDQRAVEDRAREPEADQGCARASVDQLACSRRRRVTASIVTAPSRTAPVIMNLTSESSASRSMPLEIDPITTRRAAPTRRSRGRRTGSCRRSPGRRSRAAGRRRSPTAG